MAIALDATYSVGPELSGVGVYSRRLLCGLAAAHPKQRFLWYYRPHRFLRSWRESLPRNASRRLLRDLPSGEVFHALNQRMDLRRPRTVTTFHDLFVLSGDYSTPEFRTRFAAQARLAAENSDLLIAVSYFTASQLEDLLKVDAGRIRVIPHGVEVPAVPSPHAREKLVLFVGAVQKRKNVARLLRAFDALPDDWRLVLAGAATGYGAEQELAELASLSCRHRVELKGYVTDAELKQLYARAAICAFPSLDEGFGIPVLEAMAQGIPVLTSNRSALPEVAGSAALLVNPESVDDLTAGLLKLAGDSVLRSALGERGRERARQFSWEEAVARTWAVYDELR